MVNPQHTARDDQGGQDLEQHREGVFTDQRRHFGRSRHVFGEDEQEHCQAEQNGDAQAHSLPGLRGEVKGEYGQDGENDARHHQVHDEEQDAAADVDCVADVDEWIRATRVNHHIALQVRTQQLPFAAGNILGEVGHIGFVDKIQLQTWRIRKLMSSFKDTCGSRRAVSNTYLFSCS